MPDSIRASLAGSSELYRSAGGTDSGFVDAACASFSALQPTSRESVLAQLAASNEFLVRFGH